MKWTRVIPLPLVLLSVLGTGFGQEVMHGQPTESAPVQKPAPTPDQAAPPSQSAAQAQAEAAAKSAVDPSTYVIGAQDSLLVTVWREPTLSGAVPVRPDGKISLALLGDMPAAGLTPMKLAADITEKLKKFIQDPSVYVVVTGINSQRIFLVGEVNHVGPVQMTAGMTPLQAIATAGGLTPYANSKHIYILRSGPGGQKKIPLNYKQALKGDARQNILLLAGDTIVVP